MSKIKSLLALFALGLVASTFTQTCWAASPIAPRVYFQDRDTLLQLRTEILSGGQKQLRADIVKIADAAMTVGPYSVMQKEKLPPSGDKHDFLSMAPYHWPDTKSPNGLPYIRRDGERNPEAAKIPDRDRIVDTFNTAYTLSAAYYLTGQEKYAERAALLIRTWFINPETKMNPNMNHAQYIAGVNQGRGAGLIETRGISKLVDTLGLLAGSKAWTAADEKAIQQWLTAYFQWLQESKNGRSEAKAPNNHGAWYEQQLTAVALYLGKKDFAREVLEKRVSKRIGSQMLPDGRQPLELQRTKAMHYSSFNLRALLNLQRLGDAVGVDLWNYSTPDGRSTKKALDWLLPYVSGEKKWEYQQIKDYEYDVITPTLLWSALKYKDSRYEKLAAKFVPAPKDVDQLILRAAWVMRVPSR